MIAQLSCRLLGAIGRVEMFVGRESVMLGCSGLCSVVSCVGSVVSMLVMCLISFVIFPFVSGVYYWIGCVVIWSLARRRGSVALLHNVPTYLWSFLFKSSF